MGGRRPGDEIQSPKTVAFKPSSEEASECLTANPMPLFLNRR